MEGNDAAEVLRTMRERMHKISDMVQAHDGRLLEHTLLITMLTDKVTALSEGSATSSQLQQATETLTLKFDHLTEMLKPIQKGLYVAVGLILTAVLVAVLALVIRTGP